MTCSYPACSNRPHKPYSDEAKWKITKTTTHNISIRGPNKRDIVEVAGNPEDGFCSPACAVRSRWYRSRLNPEPIWARSTVDVGDLKVFQAQLKQGRKVDVNPEEVELLEDMEEKGEIVIQNGQIQRVNPSEATEPIPDKPSRGIPSGEGSIKDRSEQPKTTESLSKSEIVAESREKTSSLMQRLEKTLADLRIVEKAANSPAKDPTTLSPPPPPSNSDLPSSSSNRASGLNATRQEVAASSPHSSLDAGQTTNVGSRSTMSNATKAPIRADRKAGNEGDDSYEDESEDDETRMVFDLALAAREQLTDGTF